MKRIRSFLTASVSAVFMLGASAAFGQSAPELQTAAPAPSSSGNTEIQEIVVTANKREQRLNDVGITADVISGSALKDSHVSSLADLAESVPGLSYANSANGTPIYTLRGVGFVESSLGAYPTVSTYLDEAPLPFPVLSNNVAFDLERVEVLKGPQGTLFGENSTGGAINFIAAKPTREFQAGADVSYGRFNDVESEAFVSGPLSDTLTARVAGRFERADGWQVSNTRPDDRNDSVRNYRLRVLLAYEPSSSARFLLNLNGWKDGGETQAPQYIAFNPQSPTTPNPVLAQYGFSPQTPRAADWTPGLPFRDNHLYQATLRGDIDIVKGITLTSLTAYTDYTQRQGDEGDGTPAISADLPLDVGKIKTVFQELRLANGSNGDLRWVAGGNYEHSTVDQSIDAGFPDCSISTELGGLGFTTFADDLRYTADQKYRNYAFFGNLEFDVAPTVTLKGGVRYTDTETSVKSFSIDPTLSPTGTGAFFYDALLGGAFGPYAGQPYAINNLGTVNNGVQPGAPGAYTGSLEQHNVSYRVGVDWKLMPGFLIYGNVSKGYKAGSFPTVSASVFSQYLPVVQESVQAYEGGIKASFLDRRLQITAAGFYYDYRDKQLRSKTVDPVFGILDILQNIPKSSIRGAEAEVTIRPVTGLVIGGAVTYLDATINQFTGINSGGVAADFSGTAIPFTPKLQLGANVNWTVPLSVRLNGFVGASVNHRSATTATIGGDENPVGVTPDNFSVYGIKAYTTADAQIGIKSSDDRWRMSIWGKNIFNTYYWNNVVAAVDVIERYAGPPATYGVSAAYRF